MAAAFGYDWETLAGSPREIGVAHGRANAERMRHLLRAFRVDLDAPWREEEFLDPLATHLPELAAELDGIVAGSGLSRRAVCALSFLVDLGTASSACTGVAFASGPDGPVLGKTSDCTPGVQQEWLRPRRVRPRSGLAAITHSHVGSPNAEMGMNEKGLAIGISGLLSRQTDRRGVGWQQDIRAVLHACATTAEAIELLRRIPIRRAGYALVVADATGDVAVVEKLVGGFGVRRAAHNVVYEANVACCPEILSEVDPAWSSDNGVQRMALLDRLLAPDAWSDFSLAGMLRLFTTHAEPAGLCQHGPQLHSQTGFFMLPARGELHLARGYTCQHNLELARLRPG